MPAKAVPVSPEQMKLNMQQMRQSNWARASALKNEPGRSSFHRAFWIDSGTTEKLAASLASHLYLPVKDDTKIAGLHAFRVEWAREDSSALPGPNLFMAVEEQLGLKLRGGKQEVPVLVLDKADKDPAAN